MASPPIVPLNLHLAARSFSFYPAILGIAHNEWRLRRATWQDWLVVNSRSNEEISIPRRFVGEISGTDHPVLIVGLLHELRCVNGVALPFERRVIQMPLAAGAENDPRHFSRSGGLAPVVAIRLEPRRRNRTFKIVGSALALLIFLYVVTANLIRTAVGRRAGGSQTRARTWHEPANSRTSRN